MEQKSVQKISSLHDILSNSYALHPRNTAVIDDSSELSYEELFWTVDALASHIKLHSIERQDRVVAFMNNSARNVISLFAINRCGATFVPLSILLKDTTLNERLEDIEPSLVITTDNYLDRVRSTGFSGPVFSLGLEDRVFTVKTHIRTTFVNEFSMFVQDCGGEIISGLGRPDDIAEILFTSGSTGKPKGIMLSNENILINIQDITSYLGNTEHDRALLIKPMVHSSTINGEILTMLCKGGTIAATGKVVTPGLILNFVERHQISVLFLTPTLLGSILYYRRFDAEKIKSLRVIHFYGSNIAESVLKDALRIFKNAELIYSYGLTEASPRVSYIKREDIERKLGSSGKPLDSVLMLLIDDDNNIISSPGQVGEIYIKGKNVMQGYFRNPELTGYILAENRLKTGDLGYIDKDGFLYVIGRKDDAINKAGVTVYPAEIENVLYGYPKVQNALVYGKEHPVAGHIICARVEAKKGTELSEKELFHHMKQFLENYKIPEKMEFVEFLEQTETGKIKRKLGES